jgi:hypothetical protein
MVAGHGREGGVELNGHDPTAALGRRHRRLPGSGPISSRRQPGPIPVGSARSSNITGGYRRRLVVPFGRLVEGRP